MPSSENSNFRELEPFSISPEGSSYRESTVPIKELLNGSNYSTKSVQSKFCLFSKKHHTQVIHKCAPCLLFSTTHNVELVQGFLEFFVLV